MTDLLEEMARRKHLMLGSVDERKIPRRPAAVFMVSGSAVS